MAQQSWLSRLAVGAALCLAAAPACADSWNEDIFGDLSNEPAAPTPLTIYHPFNFITADVGGGDIDLIALTVPAYHTFDSITLTIYSGETQSFVGLQQSATWTAGTGANVNPAALLGWTHFGPAAPGADVGQDLLDNLGVPKQGSLGFTPPLGPGVYTMLVQDTGAAVRYQFRLNLTLNLKPVGDFNGDFFVRGNDLTKWRADYGVNSGSDADGDGDSDGHDMLIWQRNLNGVFLASSAPEPGTAGLAALAVGAAAARRRRTRHN